LGYGQLKQDSYFNEVPAENQALSKTVSRALSLTESYDPETESLLFGDFYRPSSISRHQYVDYGSSQTFPIAEDDSLSQNNYRPTGFHLGSGRKLQAVSNTSTNQGVPSSNNGKIPSPYRKKRTASIVFDKELFHFYDEITIRKVDAKQKTIFKVKSAPINLTTATKVFMLDDGINPDKYTEKRFTLPKSLFYKQLFDFREADKRDSALLFMLADFNKDYKKAADKVLRTEYAINAKDYTFNAKRVVAVKPVENKEKPLITWESLQSKPGAANAYDSTTDQKPKPSTSTPNSPAPTSGSGNNQSGAKSPTTGSAPTSRRKK
jgi:hypothetical protein